MMNEAIAILAGLLLMIILPPVIVFLFKKSGRHESDPYALELMTRNPDDYFTAVDISAGADEFEEQTEPPVQEPERDEFLRQVKYSRKTNPKLHFK